MVSGAATLSRPSREHYQDAVVGDEICRGRNKRARCKGETTEGEIRLSGTGRADDQRGTAVDGDGGAMVRVRSVAHRALLRQSGAAR